MGTSFDCVICEGHGCDGPLCPPQRQLPQLRAGQSMCTHEVGVLKAPLFIFHGQDRHGFITLHYMHVLSMSLRLFGLYLSQSLCLS